MKIIKHCMLALALMAAMPSWAQTDEGVTRYVNPFIGTGQVDAHSLKGGNFPGATTPFGMVQLSPEEFVCPNGDGASGYDYSLNTIYGFAHTHLSGTGCVDLLDVMMQPSVEPITRLQGEDLYPPSATTTRRPPWDIMRFASTVLASTPSSPPPPARA